MSGPRDVRPELCRAPRDKWARYRHRLIADGRCPHCGQPCAPYYECEYRRFYKQLMEVLDREVRAGRLIKTAPATYGLPGMTTAEPSNGASGQVYPETDE